MDEAKRIAELEARIAELEAKVDPPAKPPFVPKPYQKPDYTENATKVVMPWMLEMARAVPTSLIREIVKDFGSGPAQLRPLVPPSADPPPAVATTVPLGPPRDIKYVDAIALGFAERERREALAQQLDVERKLKGQ
jgi:hypothetical protein